MKFFKISGLYDDLTLLRNVLFREFLNFSGFFYKTLSQYINVKNQIFQVKKNGQTIASNIYPRQIIYFQLEKCR